MHSIARALLLGLAIALLGFSAWLGFSSTGRAVARAGLLVLDVLPQSPLSPLHAITSPPTVEQVRFTHAGGHVQGRLYRPAGSGPFSAMIFSLGYGPNPNDSLLLQVTQDLARLGIVVLIPETPGLRQGNLVPEDVDVLVGAFQYLSSQDYVRSDRVGFAGFCIGSSMALVAAEDPRINAQVSFVNVFGGYYDAVDLLRALAAKSSRYQDQEFTWTPARQSLILFAQNVLRQMEDARDRQHLRRFLEEPAQPFGNQLRELTPLGRLGYHLLTSSDPATVDALLAQLPRHKLAELQRVSPHTGIDRLRAKVFIMHDVSDPYVPVTESWRLADAIRDPEQVVYAQFTYFDHVRPSPSSDTVTVVRDAIKLFVHLCSLLIHVTA